jgi:hypothetical protein
MNRRKFLSGVSTTVPALAATWPDFVRHAFAQQASADAPHPEDALDGLAVVSEGFRRAQRAGKPLLVFVIPKDDGQKWRRGRAFGAWLNHGSDEELWPLGLCEVACASMDDLRRLVPTAGTGEPLMILVETAAVPTTVVRLDGKLPEVDYRGRGSVNDWQQQQRREDAVVDSHIATLARLASRALVTGSRGLPLDPGTSRAERVKALANQVKSRLSLQRVPGSHWALSAGCGTRVEGHPDMGRGIMCGMGHVPQTASRFLYFYTIPKDPLKRDELP